MAPYLIVTAISEKTCNHLTVPQRYTKWGVKDSNLRRPKPTDLQSVPFVRLGNSPEKQLKMAVRLFETFYRVFTDSRRIPKFYIFNCIFSWRRESNPRPAFIPNKASGPFTRSREAKLARGLEPPTYGLQNRCSTIELRQHQLWNAK